MSVRQACVSLICLGLLGYFGYHMFVGEFGLESRARLQTEIKTLEGERRGLQALRERIERDVSLMRADKLDPDMLDERARAVLNFSHPDEIVIMTNPGADLAKP